MRKPLRLSVLAWLAWIVTSWGILGVLSASEPSAAREIVVNQIVAAGLDRPIQVTHPADGSGRLFIVEQRGTIQVLTANGLLSVPFLDIRTKVTTDGWEQGLLGLAFHPDYASNGYFYVNYTRAGDGATVVARYSVDPSDSNRADPESATLVIIIPQPFSNHNGGQIAFGPHDGYLYIGVGDGGGAGDPLEAGQDPTTLLGALLRIDVDSDAPYTIPLDNPFVGTAGLDEIWAIGLRNPWRFSFDRQNGDLYIGDVGQNAREEISFQAAGTPGGLNFGWNCLEGTLRYAWTAACEQRTFTDPIAEYEHDVGRSVTGGFVYRGTQHPNLRGRYFYGDYVSGRIWSLTRTPNGFSAPTLEVETSLAISAFGEDEAGELYVVDHSGGTIRRLIDANSPALPPDLSTSRKLPAQPGADPGERVTYTVVLANSGGPLIGTATLTDTVPAGLVYIPETLAATSGVVSATEIPSLIWQGTLDAESIVTITYQVDVTGIITGSLVNRAVLVTPDNESLSLAATLFVPRSVLTPTQRDFFLPGTQPNTLNTEIPASVNCNVCHSSPIYDAWRGSLMSQSARDPLVRAALTVANHDAPGAGEYCLRCHAPRGWFEGRSHPPDGTALTPTDITDGIACNLCHRMVDPQPSGGELASTDIAIRSALTATIPSTYTGSATLILDPDDNRRGPFTFDPQLPYHTAYQTDFLGQTSPAIIRSRACGACHDVDNPLLSWDAEREAFWPSAMDTPPNVVKGELFPIERTYTEWLNSAYPAGVYAPQFAGAKADGIVAACQDCHLRRETGIAAEPQFEPQIRNCTTTGCLPEHRIVGGNAWVPELLQDPTWRLSAENETRYLAPTAQRAREMLRLAATLSLTLTREGDNQLALVRVTNETGHKLPTGYPEGRQLWLNIRAYDAVGRPVYESGHYNWDTHRLVRDADVVVYEAKQGITPDLAAVLGKPAGASFHFILNNTVIKDNRIPPRGYTEEAWDEPGLRPVGANYEDGQHWDEIRYVLPTETVRVTAQLLYQTASTEYIEFLRDNGGIDGQQLYDLWTRNPSPPVVMASAADPSYGLFLPIIARSR